MEPDFKSLTELIDSGGNLATVGIVWLGFKIKSAVESYLKGVNDTLDQLTRAQASIDRKLDALLEVNEHARRIRTPNIAPRDR